MEKPQFINLATCAFSPAIATAGLGVCYGNIIATSCTAVALGLI